MLLSAPVLAIPSLASLRLLLVAGFDVDEPHIHGANFALCVIAEVDGIVAITQPEEKTGRLQSVPGIVQLSQSPWLS